MEPRLISDEQVRARKSHQCFCCGHDIVKGTLHRKCFLKYGYVYTLRMHNDCQDATDFLIRHHNLKWYDFEDGIPPLYEIMCEGFEADCNTLRGHFPHVVARLELSRELAEIAYQKRRLSAG